MKVCLSSMQRLAFISAILLGVSSCGQDVPKQEQERKEKESALLEKLKGYMADNDARANEVIQELVGYGSPNVVQFFLGNITWRHVEKVNGFEPVEMVRGHPKPISSRYPMLQALLKIENVPLHQCMDALLGNKDRTSKTPCWVKPSSRGPSRP